MKFHKKKSYFSSHNVTIEHAKKIRDLVVTFCNKFSNVTKMAYDMHEEICLGKNKNFTIL